jgi:hypothetical protein
MDGGGRQRGKRREWKEKLEGKQVENVGESGQLALANECGWVGEKEHAQKSSGAKSAGR